MKCDVYKAKNQESICLFLKGRETGNKKQVAVMMNIVDIMEK